MAHNLNATREEQVARDQAITDYEMDPYVERLKSNMPRERVDSADLADGPSRRTQVALTPKG
jgi:hypothetical protein